MSLFPAYAIHVFKADDNLKQDGSPASSGSGDGGVSPAREAQLLASDDGDDDGEDASPPPAPQHTHDHFYVDSRLDRGNCAVSTLYYPGRPQYRCWRSGTVVGARRAGRCWRRAEGAAGRYWGVAAGGETTSPAEVSARAAELKRALEDNPHDAALWIHYIDFQETWVGCVGAVCASERALGAAGEAGGKGAEWGVVRARAHRALRAHQPPAEYLARLQALVRAEPCEAARSELWARTVDAAGAAGGVLSVAAAATAALHHLPRDQHLYPHLFYIYGSWVRSAGLWEQLVLLVELAVAMLAPQGVRLVPPPATAEAALADYEDKVCGSGLPLSAVWVRVERARAAAHWRPAASCPDGTGRDPEGADPQRTPLPSDVADLLLPARNDNQLVHLFINILRLCKVPLLPCSSRVLAAVEGATAGEGVGGGESAEALVALLRAARRLSPAHPARAPHSPAPARAALALLLDPPHYFTDEHGYLSWVEGLWEAACGAASGRCRVALVAWRVRWHHALLLLLDPSDPGDQAEARRVRARARAAVRAWGDDSVLPVAQLARVELVGGGGKARALHVALSALRAALSTLAELREPVPRHDQRVYDALYLARVVYEVSGEGRGCGSDVGRWAVCCAALCRPLPASSALADAPPRDICDAALHECECACAAEISAGTDEAGSAWAALVPDAGEWGAARAVLVGPKRAARLVADLCGDVGSGRSEQAACALALRGAAPPSALRAFANVFPHNALLALMVSGLPLWARGSEALSLSGGSGGAGWASWVGALSALVPPLLRAASSAWSPPECSRLARACARVCEPGGDGGGGGARSGVAWALRVEAEARAALPRPGAVLVAALDRLPQHKWLLVRGAAWGGDAGELADLALERGLRLHALPDELATATAAATPAPTPTPTATHNSSALLQNTH